MASGPREPRAQRSTLHAAQGRVGGGTGPGEATLPRLLAGPAAGGGHKARADLARVRYLATGPDASTRKGVGLVQAVLAMAVATRAAPGAAFHSDRGSRSAAAAFSGQWAQAGIEQSMASAGSYCDKGMEDRSIPCTANAPRRASPSNSSGRTTESGELQ